LKTSLDIIVLDLEANTLDIPDVRITEIGAVRLAQSTLKEVSSFSTLVDGRPLPPKATGITGITDEMLAGQPAFLEAGRRFAEWVWQSGKNYLMASWGTHYDIPVLRYEYRRTTGKYPLLGKALCLKSVAYSFFWTRGVGIRRMGVETALRCLGLEFEGKPHRALDDARNEARILRAVLGVEPPAPKAQIKFGRIVDAKGAPMSEDPEEDD